MVTIRQPSRSRYMEMGAAHSKNQNVVCEKQHVIKMTGQTARVILPHQSKI